eukprot:902753_1
MCSRKKVRLHFEQRAFHMFTLVHQGCSLSLSGVVRSTNPRSTKSSDDWAELRVDSQSEITECCSVNSSNSTNTKSLEVLNVRDILRIDVQSSSLVSNERDISRNSLEPFGRMSVRCFIVNKVVLDGVGDDFENSRKLKLRVGDVNSPLDQVDVFLDYDRRRPPLGLLPGNKLTLFRVRRRLTTSKNIVLIGDSNFDFEIGDSDSIGHIMANRESSLKVPDKLLLNFSPLFRDSLDQTAFRVRCRILRIKSLQFTWRCRLCFKPAKITGSPTHNPTCPECHKSCTTDRSRHKSCCAELQVSMCCEVHDGTTSVGAWFSNRDEIMALLKVSLSRSYIDQMIRLSRIYGSFQFRRDSVLENGRLPDWPQDSIPIFSRLFENLRKSTCNLPGEIRIYCKQIEEPQLLDSSDIQPRFHDSLEFVRRPELPSEYRQWIANKQYLSTYHFPQTNLSVLRSTLLEGSVLHDEVSRTKDLYLSTNGSVQGDTSTDCTNIVDKADPPPLEVPSKIWGLDPFFRSYCKLFIERIRLLKTFHNTSGVFDLYGHPISHVEVVATLIGIRKQETFAAFTVDDGTGILRCVFWYPKSDLSQVPKFDVNLGDTVVIRGRLSQYRNSVELAVRYIARVTSHYSELLHWLDVVKLDRIYHQDFKIMHRIRKKIPGINLR